jgi:hypothetical protein
MFLLRVKNQIRTPTLARATTAQPTPMPAFAPPLKPPPFPFAPGVCVGLERGVIAVVPVVVEDVEVDAAEVIGVEATVKVAES